MKGGALTREGKKRDSRRQGRRASSDWAILTQDHTVCPDCGADHAAVVREVAGRHLSDEVLHPWHPEYEAWMTHRESRTEYQEWLEQRALA